jgi:hypothetical protein
MIFVPPKGSAQENSDAGWGMAVQLLLESQSYGWQGGVIQLSSDDYDAAGNACQQESWKPFAKAGLAAAQ